MNLFKKVTDYASDFTTYPRTFEGYRWYKPILITILAAILFLILSAILMQAAVSLNFISTPDLLASFTSEGVELEDVDGIITALVIVLLVPAFYIPSKLLKERPFSSYITSVGGWNWQAFFKSLALVILVYAVFTAIQAFITGGKIDNEFTLITFIICILITPLQCFAEEYVCRGFLMQTFGSWFRIPIIAIIIQALVFTSLHQYDIVGLTSILISGLVFGLIAWYTRGLEISTALHTANNLAAFLSTGLGLATSTSQTPVIDLVISVAALVISVALINFVEKKYAWIGIEERCG